MDINNDFKWGNIYIKKEKRNGLNDFDIDDFNIVTKRSITNIEQILNDIPRPILKIKTEKEHTMLHKQNIIDNTIDIKNIKSLPDKSIGSIFINTHTITHDKLKKYIIENIHRILKYTGLLFYENGSIDCIKSIEDIGLKNIQYIHTQNKKIDTETINAVFIKLTNTK